MEENMPPNMTFNRYMRSELISREDSYADFEDFIDQTLEIISPKSLLRNPEAVSSLEDLYNGSFSCVIDGDSDKKKVNKVIMCSGKVFYDLYKKKKENNIKDIALIRIEQLYPFPYDDLEEILTKYENVQEFVWCQEEP